MRIRGVFLAVLNDINRHISYILTSKGIIFFSEFTERAFITRDDFRFMLMRRKSDKILSPNFLGTSFGPI